jgi:hypothetical protein
MTTWPRLKQALHHERWVLSQIRPRVDIAEPFGQALFSERLREVLKKCQSAPGMPSPVRWIPDIICIQNGRVTLIEAKAGDKWKQTGNHAVEKDSLEAAHRWRLVMSADVWFIFSDGRAASADALINPGNNVRREGSFLGSGSGTPFWYWPASVMQQLIEPTPPCDGDRCPICGDADGD